MTPEQFFTLSELGLDGAHIINNRTGDARPIEFDDQYTHSSDGIWDWLNRSLMPNEVVVFGWHQAGTA